MTGIELIAKERERQIKVERFTSSHDDKNLPGAMAMAGACYACNAATMVRFAGPEQLQNYAKWSSPGFKWPWNEKRWKPKGPVRDLVRAGALIAAEIDRLQRIEK